MAGHIFNIQDDGKLVEMNEQPFENEDIFQTLLEKYPNLLAGDQINSNEPRRWLLIRREMGVPDEALAANRWSIDHLFLDQDAIPTLVEVKRSSDTRIRREVVGQMLDYAANGVAHWSIEQIIAEFEKQCGVDGIDANQRLEDFLGDGRDSDDYWKSVKTNLQAGKIRMLFVADVIPPELRRIVEFLNEQMDPAEVLAVEIKHYVGQGLKTLVPRVIGQTAEAESRKGVSGTSTNARTTISQKEFTEKLESMNDTSSVGKAAKRIFNELVKCPDLQPEYYHTAKSQTICAFKRKIDELKLWIVSAEYKNGKQQRCFASISPRKRDKWPEPLTKELESILGIELKNGLGREILPWCSKSEENTTILIEFIKKAATIS